MAKLKSIKILDKRKDVYDITVKDNHNFFANDILVSNCSEIGLPENGSCNLGAINLTQFINAKSGKTNYDELENVVDIGVKFLDKIIDINPYYQKGIKNHQKQFRNIGLGIMGLADFLILKRVKYGSKESLEEVEKIMSFIQRCAFLSSNELARKKGVAPAWDESMVNNKYIKQLHQPYQKMIKEDGLRHTKIITCAPTGTTATLAGVSSGIEPNFTFKNLIRRDRLGERKEDQHWLYKRRKELDLDEELFVESSDLTVEQHIKMQATVQKYIDNSISKTINAKADASKKDTQKAFMLAYDEGCKGITYYRNGSRKGVLIKEENKEEVSELEQKFNEAGDSIIKDNVKIPKEPPVKLYKRRDNHSKKWYFFIAFADRQYNRPFALFIKTNNYAKTDVSDWVISKMERLIATRGINEKLIVEQIKKYSNQSNADKIARTIGMALRHNIPIIEIVQKLNECDPDFSSLLFHIKKLLELFIPDGTELERKCDDCGGKMIMQEGCAICVECGVSQCD